MRLYITAHKCGRNGETESAAWKEKEAHDRAMGHLHLFCMCVSHSAVGCGLCLSWIRAIELPVTSRAGRWKPEEDAGKGGQESKEPGKAVGWWAAANLGFEWPVTSHCTATQKAASKKKKKQRGKERAVELCLHVSSQRQSIVEKRRGQNWLKVVDHKWRYWFQGQSRRMRSWNKLK